MPIIERLEGWEILDSRGRPTVKALCRFTNGFQGVASVPSGASTGTAEAVELRDEEPKRYRGLGCRKAAGHISKEISNALAGRALWTQAEFDQALIRLDGTADKRRLGANALLACSLAFARANAVSRGLPLYLIFSELAKRTLYFLPRPTINLFSGGKHAGSQVPVQDVLVVPASARTMADALEMAWEVYQCAAELGQEKYGVRPLTADEGGLAPPFPSVEAMLDDAMESIRRAGLKPGRDVALAMDVASSHFYVDGCYRLGEETLDSGQMIERLGVWLDHYPIVSIEDGLAEADWENWPRLVSRVAGAALVLGDDLLCTNPTLIRRAIAERAADALLLKVNQIGTLIEASEAYELARAAGWRVTVSARSGETEDNWLADLAFGWQGDQIKIGSLTQSERLAKYNRLLEIETATHLPLVDWPRCEKR